MNTKNLSLISLYSFSHMAVDLTCIATIMHIYFLNIMDISEFTIALILYNILAFGLQLPFGFIADEFKTSKQTALTGLLLAATSVFFFSVPYAAASFLGIANALFHVGGGIVALNIKKGFATYPGIYVAPGALGLMLGALIGLKGYFNPIYFSIPLILLALLTSIIKLPLIEICHGTYKKAHTLEIIVLLLLLVISFRGLIGLSLILPWKSSMPLYVALVLAIVFGKALGGFIGDKLGWRKVTTIGLLVSAPLLSFFESIPVLAIIGAFAFNLTMPITLTALANTLKGYTGTAFGLTTVALITGAALTYTPLKQVLTNNYVILGAMLISTIAIYLALSSYFSNFHKNFKFEKKVRP